MVFRQIYWKTATTTKQPLSTNAKHLKLMFPKWLNFSLHNSEASWLCRRKSLSEVNFITIKTTVSSVSAWPDRKTKCSAQTKCLRFKAGRERERAYRSLVPTASSVSKILFLDPAYLMKPIRPWFALNGTILPCCSSICSDLFIYELAKLDCHLS